MRWLLLLLSLFTLFSIFTYKHYGITWDEEIEIHRGRYLVEYLLGKVSEDTYFNTIKERLTFAYNHLYPAILGIGNVLLNFLSSKQFPQIDFENIHLLNLLFNGFLLIAISYTCFIEYTKFHYMRY
jgi:hypothetical protein